MATQTSVRDFLSYGIEGYCQAICGLTKSTNVSDMTRTLQLLGGT